MSLIKLTIPICACGQKAQKCDYCKLRLCKKCMSLYNIEYITCHMCKRTSCYQHSFRPQKGFSSYDIPFVGSPKDHDNYEIKLKTYIRKTRNVKKNTQRNDPWCLKMGIIPVKPKRDIPVVLFSSGEMTCCSCKVSL